MRLFADCRLADHPFDLNVLHYFPPGVWLGFIRKDHFRAVRNRVLLREFDRILPSVVYKGNFLTSIIQQGYIVKAQNPFVHFRFARSAVIFLQC